MSWWIRKYIVYTHCNEIQQSQQFKGNPQLLKTVCLSFSNSHVSPKSRYAIRQTSWFHRCRQPGTFVDRFDSYPQSGKSGKSLPFCRGLPALHCSSLADIDNLRILSCSYFPLIPRVVIALKVDWTGNHLQPTSNRNTNAFNPLLWMSSAKFKYFAFFVWDCKFQHYDLLTFMGP